MSFGASFFPGIKDTADLFFRRKVSIDNIQKELGRIGSWRTGMAYGLKVWKCILGVSTERFTPTRHDHDLIKAIVHLGGRLVDRTNDNDAFLSRHTYNLLHNG
jgi:hypothetical protein